MKKIIDNKERYVVIDKKRETSDVVTLSMVREDGSVPIYIPGQFITVYFEELGTPEGKSYSISSPIGSPTMTITVKSIGEFSKRLSALVPEDKLIASAPYGFFFSENTESNMVIIAAGIGIAPFKSMINESFKINPKRNIYLFYTNKNKSGIIWRNDLREIAYNFPNLKIYHFITRDTEVHSDMIRGRIENKYIVKNVPNFSNTEFFICGSISFVRDMWKNLKELNIEEENIYTEAFFSH